MVMLIKARDRKEFKSISGIIKALMVLGILSMVLVGMEY
jgi:hypothetical protein